MIPGLTCAASGCVNLHVVLGAVIIRARVRLNALLRKLLPEDDARMQVLAAQLVLCTLAAGPPHTLEKGNLERASPAQRVLLHRRVGCAGARHGTLELDAIIANAWLCGPTSTQPAHRPTTRTTTALCCMVAEQCFGVLFMCLALRFPFSSVRPTNPIS